jgi:hypothetical protein
MRLVEGVDGCLMDAIATDHEGLHHLMHHHEQRLIVRQPARHPDLQAFCE